MKQKIKPKQDYNIIVMRDDNKMRTFRIKRSSVTALKFFLFLLVCAGIAGCIGALHYHERFRNLQAKSNEQRQELTTLKLQLEQFTNLRTLANNTNMPTAALLNEEVESINNLGGNSSYNAVGTASSAANVAPLVNPAPLATPDSPATQNPPAEATALVPSSASASNVPPDEPTPPVEPQAPAQPELGQKAKDALSLPPISEDPSPLRINGFVGTVVGEERIKINYTLNTVDAKKTSGAVTYGVLTKSGELIDLPTRFSKGVTFIISYGRTMESSFPLPKGVKASEISKVLVFISLEEGKKFVESFDFS